MGQAIKKSTSDILMSYLTLGLLEISRNENNSSPISQREIMEFLGGEENGIAFKEKVSRKFIRTLKSWFTYGESESIIQRESLGYSLTDDIPNDQYADFLGGFLFLNLIEDKGHKKNLDDLLRKPGEKALSIITKLTLAKKEKNRLIIEILNNVGRPTKIDFYPNSFQLISGKWNIRGKTISPNDVFNFEIADIISIEKPRF
ncbi:MAG: hypothetical protein IT279_06290 [Ignavibacteriaceae bacterium]|nr:hypothetical protein [Ignavibacteriaceae bacterium]